MTQILTEFVVSKITRLIYGIRIFYKRSSFFFLITIFFLFHCLFEVFLIKTAVELILIKGTFELSLITVGIKLPLIIVTVKLWIKQLLITATSTV